MSATIRMPEPSASPRKIRSPRRTLAPLDGLVEMGTGSGWGEASVSPDPESAGFGVVTVVPSGPLVVIWSVKSILAQIRPQMPAGLLSDGLDRGQQTLLELVGERDVSGLRQAGLALV